MRDENCIFCKIIAGEIPSNTIYEDDEFKVVLDVSFLASFMASAATFSSISYRSA